VTRLRTILAWPFSGLALLLFVVGGLFACAAEVVAGDDPGAGPDSYRRRS
jgi:hypothetical protein